MAHCQETKQSREPDSEMSQMLRLSGGEFKILYDWYVKDYIRDLGSIWCRSRMWSPTFPKNTSKKKKSICGTILTEHLPNADRRPHTSKKGQENLHITGQNKRRIKREREEKKRSQDGTSTTKRELWKRKGIHTMGGLLTGEGTSQYRGESQSLGWKHST